MPLLKQFTNGDNMYWVGFFYYMHRSSKHQKLFQQVVQTPKQHVYVHKFLGYNFKIEYIAGCANKAEEALSRMHEEQNLDEDFHMNMMIASFSTPDFLRVLHVESKELEDLIWLHRQFESNMLSPTQCEMEFYCLKGGFILVLRMFLKMNCCMNFIPLHWRAMLESSEH